MDPLTGLGLVRAKLVQDIDVKNGVVHVIVDLPSSHQFASAIKQEIHEKLDTLWDVKEVVIDFVE
jgi:hypothetical protein